jgi:hypothetical protein
MHLKNHEWSPHIKSHFYSRYLNIIINIGLGSIDYGKMETTLVALGEASPTPAPSPEPSPAPSLSPNPTEECET